MASHSPGINERHYRMALYLAQERRSTDHLNTVTTIGQNIDRVRAKPLDCIALHSKIQRCEGNSVIYDFSSYVVDMHAYAWAFLCQIGSDAAIN